MPIDLCYAKVKCSDCGVKYQCTPDRDYYHPVGFPPNNKTADNGYCWNCLLKLTAPHIAGQAEPPYKPL